MITAKSVVSQNKSISATELPDGGAVLISLENRYFYTFNDSAFKIWKLINGKRNVSDIAGKISKEYGIDKQQADKLIIQQIKKFLSANMIKAIK